MIVAVVREVGGDLQAADRVAQRRGPAGPRTASARGTRCEWTTSTPGPNRSPAGTCGTAKRPDAATTASRAACRCGRSRRPRRRGPSGRRPAGPTARAPRSASAVDDAECGRRRRAARRATCSAVGNIGQRAGAGRVARSASSRRSCSPACRARRPSARRREPLAAEVVGGCSMTCDGEAALGELLGRRDARGTAADDGDPCVRWGERWCACRAPSQRRARRVSFEFPTGPYEFPIASRHGPAVGTSTRRSGRATVSSRRPRPTRSSPIGMPRSASRRRSTSSRASRLSLPAGRPSDSSRRSSRFENAVRPGRRVLAQQRPEDPSGHALHDVLAVAEDRVVGLVVRDLRAPVRPVRGRRGRRGLAGPRRACPARRQGRREVRAEQAQRGLPGADERRRALGLEVQDAEHVVAQRQRHRRGAAGGRQAGQRRPRAGPAPRP